MKQLMLVVSCLAILAACSCQKQESQTDTPAGHPDELRDSTRLDAAPVGRDSAPSEDTSGTR